MLTHPPIPARESFSTSPLTVINPLFPALRSDALALSGASRRKQIGGLSGSRLFVPLHEQIDRGGTGGPW